MVENQKYKYIEQLSQEEKYTGELLTQKEKYVSTSKDSFISAKSKVQRRLFGMALAHKRGKLDKKYLTPEIELIASEFSEEKLAKIAGTNQIIHKGKNAGKNRIPLRKKPSKSKRDD